MVATCLQVVGFVTSFVGWIGIIVTTSTNDWVVTCSYTIPTCRKMDELGSKGLWADCVMATGLYHCKPLVDILILPGKGPRACKQLPEAGRARNGGFRQGSQKFGDSETSGYIFDISNPTL